MGAGARSPVAARMPLRPVPGEAGAVQLQYIVHQT